MFHPDYGSARAAFRAMATEAGGQLSALEVIPPTADETEGLTIDAAIFGDGPNVLLISSGLHGVEGFAGSAIQLDLLNRGLPSDVRVVLVHGLNPYGMAHIRRVNEHNVDLNRNFLPPGEAYEGASESYARLDPLLNPPRPAGGMEFRLVRTVLQIIRHGYNALKTAVVGGQYEFPKGLFYGGAQLERGPALLQEALPRWLAGAEQIVHIDVHTGLGKSGTYALLVDTDAGSADHLRLRAAYGDRVQPWSADNGVAYQIRGGLPAAMTRLFGATIDVLTCEFGTLAALTVLQALQTENQTHHWGGDEAAAKRTLLSAFRPARPAWERAILAGGTQVVDQALQQLRAPTLDDSA